ncbi:MAG: Holliday junction resolvase RuvX [Burkholderiales bacterium]
MADSAAGTVNANVAGHSPRGAVLAFDFGQRRVGVAVGDRDLRIAHPLQTIDAAGSADRLSRIEALVREWKPVLFVVGLPVNLDGTEHPLAPQARTFARKLSERFGMETRLVDERYSSSEASLMLREAGVRGRAQKAHLDHFAAKTILEDFFGNDDVHA